MASVKLTGFADEIDADPQVQIEVLVETGVRFIELRGVAGKGVLDLDAGEIEAFKRDLDAAGIGVSAIGSPIGKVQIRSDLEAHFAQFELALVRARQFETDYVRIFSFYHQDEEAAACRVEVIGQVSAFGGHSSVINRGSLYLWETLIRRLPCHKKSSRRKTSYDGNGCSSRGKPTLGSPSFWGESPYCATVG